MVKKWTTTAVAAVVGLVAMIAVGGGIARADSQSASSLVEDYSYPNADAVLAEHNIKLISGDGKIVIADCSNPPNSDITFIYVYTSDVSVNGGNPVCFRVLGTPGVLTMDVPAVYEIRGDGRITGSGKGHDVTAVIQPQGGAQTTIAVARDHSTSVGIGTLPAGAPTTLLQLNAKA